MKRFKHFSYVYTSTKKIIQNNAWLNEKQLKDTIIKIGVVGKCNKENLHLFPKGKSNSFTCLSRSLKKCDVTSIFINHLLIGQTDLNGEKQNVWEAVPVVCFQNDLSVQSAIEVCFFQCFFKMNVLNQLFNLLIFVKLNTLLFYLHKQFFLWL